MLSEKEVEAVISQMQTLVINQILVPVRRDLHTFWRNHLLTTDTSDALVNGKFAYQRVYCKVHSVFVSSKMAVKLAVRRNPQSIRSLIEDRWYEQPYSPIYKPRISVGQTMEPAALRLYRETTGYSTRRCKNANNPKISFLIASPDGLVFSQGKPTRVVEVKTVSNPAANFSMKRNYYTSDNGLAVKKDSLAYGQMQSTLLALNLEVADLVLYFPYLRNIQIIPEQRQCFVEPTLASSLS